MNEHEAGLVRLDTARAAELTQTLDGSAVESGWLILGALLGVIGIAAAWATFALCSLGLEMMR
ncbi:MAG: hypothetical protein ACREC9_12330 [Methylocella sp.]